MSSYYIPMKAILGSERDKAGAKLFWPYNYGNTALFRDQEIGSVTKITSLPTFARNKGKIFLISSINAYDAEILDGLNPGQ